MHQSVIVLFAQLNKSLCNPDSTEMLMSSTYVTAEDKNRSRLY